MRTKNDRRILNAFGNNLKRHRKAAGYSIREFAALADLNPTVIDRYERGQSNCSITRLCYLAGVLKISVADLLS